SNDGERLLIGTGKLGLRPHELGRPPKFGQEQSTYWELRDTTTGQPVSLIRGFGHEDSLFFLSPTQQHAVLAVAFSPDGNTILTGSGHSDPLKADEQPGWEGKGEAQLWSAHRRERLGKPLAHQGAVWAVAFSPDGKAVLTGSADRTAQLWDL